MYTYTSTRGLLVLFSSRKYIGIYWSVKLEDACEKFARGSDGKGLKSSYIAEPLGIADQYIDGPVFVFRLHSRSRERAFVRWIMRARL